MSFHSTKIRESATRRLCYAIAASLLAHLLLLWPGSTRLLTKDTLSPLQATLNFPPQAPAKFPPTTPTSRAVPPTPTPASPAPKLEPVRYDSPESPSVPPSLTVPAGSEPVSAAGLKQAPVLAAGAPVPATPDLLAGLPLTEANASGAAVGGLRAYRLAVASQARRFKRYPAQAMTSGWAGSTDIRLEVGSDGQLRAAAVIRSSGHEALDQAALAMIDAGAWRAHLPDSLRGKAFAVVLPVVFDLDD